MKIEENKLVRIPYFSKEFTNKLYIEKIDGLIFDSIKIFGWNGDKKDNMEKCMFSIIKSINDISIVIPMTPYDKYIMVAEMIRNARVIEFNAEDYIKCHATMNGTYEFVLNNKVDNNFDDFLKEYTHE